MNEFHRYLVAKFFPDANYEGLTIAEINTFIEQIETVCKAQRNACARVYERDYIDKGGYNIHDYIASAEIERCDYE